MTSFTVPNTFVASTVISSSEMNANFTAVATAFTNSLGIAGAETMTGTFKAANGTAALPGITFGVDPDSGIFRKAANTLGFSVAGAEVGNWDASNLNILGGLTVGTIAATAALTITAASPQITLIDSDTGADNRIDADNASGSIVYSADLNNEIANSTHVWALDGTNQMVLTAAALTPAADDGKTLGTASLQWADLFLASGAVINFNAGDVTITHSANLLTLAGGNLNLGGAYIDMTEQTAPSAPASNVGRVYAADDGAGQTRLYFKDSAGLETDMISKSINRGTVQATTSGTAFDFTDIPAGVNRITVMLSQVSLSGTDNFLIQLGDSGGIETTGYESSAGDRGTDVSSTSGFIMKAANATNTFSGTAHLTRITGNTWVFSYVLGRISNESPTFGGGRKALSAELDRIRVTRSGTDTFDSGQVNIFWEI